MSAGHKSDVPPQKAKKANGIGALSNEDLPIGLPLVQKVVSGFDLKKINAGNIALIWGVADAVFAWEKQVMILGEPTDEDRKQHKSTIGFLLKVVTPLAKFSGDKQLELLRIRLEDSVGMFYGMSEEEAAQTLSVFK